MNKFANRLLVLMAFFALCSCSEKQAKLEFNENGEFKILQWRKSYVCRNCCIIVIFSLCQSCFNHFFTTVYKEYFIYAKFTEKYVCFSCRFVYSVNFSIFKT